MSAVVFITFCLEIGLFLLIFPWTEYWDGNYFSSLLPQLRDYWNNMYVRGAVSGLGVVNLLHLPGRNLPPAPFRETISVSPAAHRHRVHCLRFSLPLPFRFRPHRREPAVDSAARLAGENRRFEWRDAGVNLLLYFPLGAPLSLAWRAACRARWRPLRPAAGTGLSVSIEMLQIYDAARTCSLVDVICNFSGPPAEWPPCCSSRRSSLTGGARRAGALRARCCWPAVGADISSTRLSRY